MTAPAYMLAMGVCGIVLVAIGCTLDDLTNQIDRTTTSIGSVFIARGSGSIFSVIVFSMLYSFFPWDSLLLPSLMSVMATLILLPFTNTISQLYIYFFSSDWERPLQILDVSYILANFTKKMLVLG